MANLQQLVGLAMTGAAMTFAPYVSVANPNVWDLVIGESDREYVASRYQITHTAIISAERTSVHELALDQFESDDFFSQNKLNSATLYFNKTSMLSGIHLIYENWDFPDALTALDSRFEKEHEPEHSYGDESVVYRWPDFSVTCFADSTSGFTHVIFSINTVDQ